MFKIKSTSPDSGLLSPNSNLEEEKQAFENHFKNQTANQLKNNYEERLNSPGATPRQQKILTKAIHILNEQNSSNPEQFKTNYFPRIIELSDNILRQARSEVDGNCCLRVWSCVKRLFQACAQQNKQLVQVMPASS